MRKALILCTLLVSFNALAATNIPQNLSSAIKTALRSHSTVQTIKSAFPLIYGGQDIKPLVATADETLWSGQRKLIG